MNINFTIRGNHEDPEGNPVPYQRLLNNAWRRAGARYVEWQNFVQTTFASAVSGGAAGSSRARTCVARAMQNKNPIELADGETAEMDVAIYWKNKAHGDGDNVYKGIADALFENDKGIVRGSFESAMSEDKKGRVEVKIKINET